MAARFARVEPSRPRRSARTTEVDDPRVTPAMGSPVVIEPVRAPTRSPVARASSAGPVESLAEALRGKKLGQIERARKLARKRGHDQVARELYAIAKRASGDARANALGVLVAVARPQDGAELARYLGDPERSVQSVAVDGVKRTGYAAAVPALAALVVGRDARPTSARSLLAASAATAMKVLSGKRGIAALTGYLTSDDPRVREAACVALTMSGGPATTRTRPMLERLLADGDARVVKAARRALAAR
jgi:HEAT repeat protein